MNLMVTREQVQTAMRSLKKENEPDKGVEGTDVPTFDPLILGGAGAGLLHSDPVFPSETSILQLSSPALI